MFFMDKIHFMVQFSGYSILRRISLLSCRRINAFSWTKFILWLNFQVLRDDKRGFGILVSSVPKDSHALYSLIDPSEVGS